MRKFGTAAAIVAIAASAFVAAAPAGATVDEVRIATRDLDLGSVEGRRALRHRIDHAVNRVCPIERQLALTAACHRAALESVSTQLAGLNRRS